jgi:hypothetical protein
MPLFCTLGSLYEFKTIVPKPLPPENVTLSRLPGYNLQANYTSTPLPPYYFTETYTGKLSNLNYYNSSSNTTSMDFSKVSPYSNYYATIFTTTVTGTSFGANSPNFYMTSNLIANGNTTIANATALIAAPNGTEVSLGTTNGYLLRYSRNNSTGQLTLLSNTFIANNQITSLTYSADSNFLYIMANNGAQIYNYNLSSNTFAQTGLTNLRSVGTFLDCRIFCNNNNNNIIAFGYTQNPFSGNDYRIQNYSRNTSTGTLTLQQSVVVGSNFSPVTNWRPIYNGNAHIVVGTGGNGNAQINLYTANSTTIAFQSRANLFLNSNNTNAMNSVCLIGNSAYINLGNNINSYNFTTTFTSIGNINTGNVGFPFCPVQPASNARTSILLYNGSLTYRRNSNGTLTLDSSSSSFLAGNSNTQATIPDDTKHVYALRGNTLTVYNVTG